MASKKRVGAIASAFVLLFMLVSCQNGEAEVNGTVDVYYAVRAIDPSAQDASVVRPVKVPLPRDADPLRFALETMLQVPTDDTLYSVVPAGTMLVSLFAEDGMVVLRLSDEWESATGLSKTLLEYCMVKTALQFDDVGAVRWEVQTDTDTVLTGPLLREESYIEAPLVMVSARHEIKLYFSDTTESALVPETRQIVLRESESSEWYRLVVDGLIAGPVTGGVLPVMPERTRLTSVTMDGRICIVNFSREFVTNAGGDPLTARMTLLALVNSLTELQGVSFVKIRVEGEDLAEYYGWDTSKPLERNDKALSE